MRWAEVDIQQVVFFGHYLTYCDEALMEYLRLFGFGFKDIWAQGLDWVYADAHITYKGSAQFEDTLSVHVRIGRIGHSSIKAELQIFKQPSPDVVSTSPLSHVGRGDRGEGELIATAELAFVVVDYTTRKPTRVPDWFRETVKQYQGRQVGR